MQCSAFVLAKGFRQRIFLLTKFLFWKIFFSHVLISIFEEASFWKYLSPRRNNPGEHLSLRGPLWK